VRTGQPLDDGDFLTAVHDFEDTAFRLELQLSYAEPSEDELFAAWLDGSTGITARSAPELAKWYDHVAKHIGLGKRVERVRVQEDPPTNYQQFERWLDQTGNLPAGEIMRYLPVQRAHEIGLLPAAGRDDWWLLDSSRLIVMHFDDTGHRAGNEIVTDPVAVVQACRWRDLAVHHSSRAEPSGAAA
jgi:hypothetical protein